MNRTQDPRKTGENHAPTFGKTMGGNVANADETNPMTYTTTLSGDTVRFEEAPNQSADTDGGYVGRDGEVFVLYCLDYETVEVTDPNTLEVVALFDESGEHISPDTLAKQGFTPLTEAKA